MITPFALPAGIDKPEQVTQETVQAAGLKTEEKAFGNFDRVVFYPTPDSQSGRTYLSVRLEQKSLSEQADSVLKFYVPAAGLTVPTQAQIEDMRKHPKGTKANARPVGYGAFTWWQILLFLVVLVFVITTLVRLWKVGHKPPPVKKLYTAPEIEIENFETPGVVPDLNAIEAAMYLGDSAKVIMLLVMSLAARGIVNVVNRRPMQLELLTPEATDLTDYEKILISSIAEDGTLDKARVPYVLEAVARSLQLKVWNADKGATRRKYEDEIERRWDEARSGAGLDAQPQRLGRPSAVADSLERLRPPLARQRPGYGGDAGRLRRHGTGTRRRQSRGGRRGLLARGGGEGREHGQRRSRGRRGAGRPGWPPPSATTPAIAPAIRLP